MSIINFKQTPSVDALTPERIVRDIKSRIEENVKASIQEEHRKSVTVSQTGTMISFDVLQSGEKSFYLQGDNYKAVRYQDAIYKYTARDNRDKGRTPKESIENTVRRSMDDLGR